MARGRPRNNFNRAYGWVNRETDIEKAAEWRQIVIKIDKYICQLCDKKCSRNWLQAHHIRRWIDCPTLRYDPDNGVALCRPCHKSIKDIEEQYTALFLKRVSQRDSSPCRLDTLREKYGIRPPEKEDDDGEKETPSGPK